MSAGRRRLAAAAAPLRRRAGRRAGGGRRRRACTTCPGSAGTCTTTRCAASSTRRARRSRRAPTNHAETSMLWRSDDSLPGPGHAAHVHPRAVPPATPAARRRTRYTFGVACVPEARGSVTIAGPDPRRGAGDRPELPRRGGRRASGWWTASRSPASIAATAPFAAWQGREVLPGPDVTTDERAARRSRRPAPAPTTTRSGPARWAPAADAVVDPELRVHGLERPPRRGRLGDAADGLRQHQRRHDHDRREGRRPDPAARTAPDPARQHHRSRTGRHETVSWTALHGRARSSATAGRDAHGGVLDAIEPATGEVLAPGRPRRRRGHRGGDRPRPRGAAGVGGEDRPRAGGVLRKAARGPRGQPRRVRDLAGPRGRLRAGQGGVRGRPGARRALGGGRAADPALGPPAADRASPAATRVARRVPLGVVGRDLARGTSRRS